MTSPAGFFVRNWQFSALVLLLLAVLGVMSWNTTPRSADPSYSPPIFLVVAVMPGAPPKQMEALVTDPLEDRIRSMRNLHRVRSTIYDSAVLTRVDFDFDTDPDDMYADLLRELEAARPDLPDELEQIEVIRYQPSQVVIMQYAIIADTATLQEVRGAAETIETAIDDVPGVRDATIEGLPDEQVRIDVDTDALSALGLPVGLVFQAIQSNHARIPGGHIERGSRRLSVTPETAYEDLEALKAMVVASHGSDQVRLGDLARIEQRHADPESFVRYNGRRAVWITVQMEDGENIFKVRDAAAAAVEGVKLPAGIEAVLAFDQSENVATQMSHFSRDFVIAIVLVLVTLLPLGLRASAVVMVSIPLSLAAGLAALGWLGHTLNQVSIVGFVIALGLLVDDAIVVIENVARHLREGRSAIEAAIAGTDEIALAVLGCTATLIFAFLPLLFLPGLAGVFVRGLPLAVTATVLASLAISLTIVPLLASWWLVAEGEHGNRVLQLMDRVIEASYRRVLDRAIASPRATLLASFVFVMVSFATVPIIGFSLFPKAGIPQFLILIDAGAGASLDHTDAAVRFVEEELEKHPEVIAVMSNIGSGNPMVYYNLTPPQPMSSIGQVFARLDIHEEIEPELIDELREVFSSYLGAEITVHEFEQGPEIDAPIAIRLLGDDLDHLEAASGMVEDLLRRTHGLWDIKNPVGVTRTDLSVHVDRTAAGQLGVPVADVARTVRFGLAGIELGTVREPDGSELPILVRAANPGSIERIGALPVGGPPPVPLSAVARFDLESAPSLLFHQNGTRSSTVTARVERGLNVASLTSSIASTLEQMDLPSDIRWELGGEYESQQESFGGVGVAAVVAGFGILAVLVLEFRTFRGVLVVASVIPLGVAGGLWALLLSGNSLSFTASIGFVALTGIEIKNSILLVDFANQLRQEGMPLDAAIARAGELRFLPIVLTTATALGALVPLALENSALYSPLALVIIGGLISSTVLARIVTPVTYKLLAPPLT